MAENYVVVGQRPTSVLTPGGGFADVVEINFTTKSGDHGTLRLSAADYANKDLVKQKLDDLAAHMEYVRNL